MISFVIFIVSGAVIVLLIGTKLWETKRRKTFIISRAISMSDERIRSLSHNATEAYSTIKQKGEFFVKKQLPIHTKNLINKTETFAKEQTEKYLGDIRNTRLLNPKNEGISEFFRNISDMEKETAEAAEVQEPAPAPASLPPVIPEEPIIVAEAPKEEVIKPTKVTRRRKKI